MHQTSPVPLRTNILDPDIRRAAESWLLRDTRAPSLSRIERSEWLQRRAFGEALVLVGAAGPLAVLLLDTLSDSRLEHPVLPMVALLVGRGVSSLVAVRTRIPNFPLLAGLLLSAFLAQAEYESAVSLGPLVALAPVAPLLAWSFFERSQAILSSRIEYFLFGWEEHPSGSGWRYLYAFRDLTRPNKHPMTMLEAGRFVDRAGAGNERSQFTAMLTRDDAPVEASGHEERSLVVYAALSAAIAAALDGVASWCFAQGQTDLPLVPLLVLSSCFGLIAHLLRVLPGWRFAQCFAFACASLIGHRILPDFAVIGVVVSSFVFHFVYLHHRLAYGLALARASGLDAPAISVLAMLGQDSEAKPLLGVRYDREIERRLRLFLGRVLSTM